MPDPIYGSGKLHSLILEDGDQPMPPTAPSDDHGSGSGANVVGNPTPMPVPSPRKS